MNCHKSIICEEVIECHKSIICEKVIECHKHIICVKVIKVTKVFFVTLHITCKLSVQTLHSMCVKLQKPQTFLWLKFPNDSIITVLESTDSRIPIGSVILFGHIHNIRYITIPKCTITYEIDIINKCLESNFIYALRKGKSKELIVTHSNKLSIPIGTAVVKIDSVLVDQLSNESIIALLQDPILIVQDLINGMQKHYKQKLRKEEFLYAHFVWSKWNAQTNVNKALCMIVNLQLVLKLTQYMQFQKNQFWMAILLVQYQMNC